MLVALYKYSTINNTKKKDDIELHSYIYLHEYFYNFIKFIHYTILISIFNQLKLQKFWVTESSGVQLDYVQYSTLPHVVWADSTWTLSSLRTVLGQSKQS